jgi:hypothetical protein
MGKTLRQSPADNILTGSICRQDLADEQTKGVKRWIDTLTIADNMGADYSGYFCFAQYITEYTIT